MTDITPPPLHAPSSKEKKYDRQLRLWAASGQAALEEAHVLLVNSGCGVVGVEALKNLVLPGIGHFTILDPETVDIADLGVNFFLSENSLGQSRAKHCCGFLQELNPDVHGAYIAESIEDCLEKPDFLNPFTLIVLTSPISRSALQAISTYSRERHVPLVYAHSVGFYSHFSVSLPSAFPIVETHPEATSATELRLLNPWPELSSLVKEKTKALEELSSHDHGHVPYVLLLLHYLEVWKDAHEGKPPQSYKEKRAFGEFVRTGARLDSHGGGEENYDEAVGAVLKTLTPPSIGPGLKEVFEAKECKELSKESVNFWLIASAIASFYERHSVLPLPGSLPDMKAQSADYIQLQNVYKSKARKDFAEVLADVRELETRLGRTYPIDEKEVEAFCKEAKSVKLVRGRALHMATAGTGSLRWNDRAQFAYQELQEPESLLPIYIAFLAYDIYIHDPAGRKQQSDDDNEEEMLFQQAVKILDELWRENGKDLAEEMNEMTNADDDDDSGGGDVKMKTPMEKIRLVIQEILRAKDSELHNISAITGGMMAQEMIKIITKQYILMDNTCVFDGVRSRAGVFRL